jgi:hypothetical protein
MAASVSGGLSDGVPVRRNSSRRRGIVPSSTPTTGRGRPRQAEGAFATGARAQAGPQRPVIIAGHAFIQNLRRGHYEPAVEQPINRRLVVAFDELILTI